jgi:hypothetical protein
MACKLCLDYWGTTTCVLSSRPTCTESAEEPNLVQRDNNADNAEPPTSSANLLAVWYLVRQDLYLNDQATAFLVIHWKHTLDLISLLDVIPGDGTKLIGK